MNAERLSWDEDAISARDAHLQRLNQTLRDAGVEADEAQMICDDVYQQIESMCQERVEQGTVSMGLLDEVLDELESIESLAKEASAHSQQPEADERFAVRILLSRLSLIICIGGLLIAPFIGVLADDDGEASMSFNFFAQLIAIICALCSFKAPLSRITILLIVV